MVASSFKFGPGITLTGGMTLYPSGVSGGTGSFTPLTIQFTEFDGTSDPASDPGNPNTFLEDFSTGTPGSGWTTNGFIIVNSGNAGVFMGALSNTNDGIASGDTPWNNASYLWNVTWASGSTTTMTNASLSYLGDNQIVFYVLDPSDSTNSTGLAGTFIFPATFTPTTTPL